MSKHMNKGTKTMWELMLVIVGNMLLAFGVAAFVIPNDLLTGGVAGIAVALKPLIPLTTQQLIHILTILLFLFGSLSLGKSFAMKTILSTICYPLFLTMLSIWIPRLQLSQDPLFAAVYSGIFMGIGVGLIFSTNASSGGMDIPPLILHKYSRLPLSLLVLLTDGFTVLLGMAMYGMNAALFGIISVCVSSFMIDKTLMLGAKKNKNIFVISQHYEKIIETIDDVLERGATLMEGCGCYSRQRRPIIMVCISKKQYPQLMHLIAEIDDEAFIIAHNVDEIHGQGFTIRT